MDKKQWAAWIPGSKERQKPKALSPKVEHLDYRLGYIHAITDLGKG